MLLSKREKTLFTGNSAGKGRGHISMIFNRRLRYLTNMPEKVIYASCDSLMDIFKVAYPFFFFFFFSVGEAGPTRLKHIKGARKSI